MNIGKRIKDRRNQLDKTQQEIADYVGVTKSAVSKWETGDIHKVGIDKLISLSKILMIDPMDLIKDVEFSKETKPNDYNTHTLPVIQWDDVVTSGITLDKLDNFYVDSKIGADFTIKMVDNSMSGMGIVTGTILLVVRQAMANIGDVCLYLHSNKLHLRRYDYDNGNVIMYNASHPHSATVYNTSDITIIGVVSAFVTMMRTQYE